MANFNYLICMTCLILLNPVASLREVSKCTSTLTSPEETNNSGFLVNRPINSLTLDCGSDLIHIAWSHYGNRKNPPPVINLKESHFDFFGSIVAPHSNSSDFNQNCYFSPRDCMVNVDYVANECNGMSNCKISLDSQYLHSCKAYSDYLFIVYECVAASSTVNICDASKYLDATHLDKNEIFIQTPNYPIEYLSNLDCSCSLKTSSGLSTQIQLLEFDLESSSIENFEPSPIKTVQLEKNLCTKDYLTIGNETQLCSTLTPYTHMQQISRSKNTQEILNFKFHSDDALTRRGFWIRVKVSQQVECPVNFILVGNMCIRVYNKLLTWYDAQNYCTGMGYSLAMLDNFELDKQLNNLLFDKAEQVITLPNEVANKNTRFWIGMKHLNETSWFNAQNEPLQMRTDEKKWWPWLVVDSATYNKGSCVGKRSNWLFLEDCYKRMPFACQYKPNAAYKTPDTPSVQLKCGPESEKYFQTSKPLIPMSTKANAKLSHDLLTSKIGLVTLGISEPSLSSSKPEKILTNINKQEAIVKSIAADNKTVQTSFVDSDPTTLITLIISVTLLIVFINSIGAIFIYNCYMKRRERLLANRSSEKSDKDSKLSQNTLNSGHNINFDELMTTTGGTNSSSSLTFNQKNATLNFNNQSTLFYPICNEINVSSNNLLRNALFLNNNHHLNKSSTILTTLNAAKKNLTKTNSRQQFQDPLSHIYETISVNSSSNSNPRSNSNNQNANHYNLLNYYHLHQSNQTSNYNDVDCDNGNLNNLNYNDLSLTDSSMSQKSQDYFIDTKKTNKISWQMRNDNFLINSNQQQHHQQQHQQLQQNRSEFNLSNTNTSSPSSTTTTITDYIATNPSQFSNISNQYLLPPEGHQPNFLLASMGDLNCHNNSTNKIKQIQNSNCQIGYNDNSSSAFVKCNTMNQAQRNNFKHSNTGISQHQQQQQHMSSFEPNSKYPPHQHNNLINNNMGNLPINFLSNQVEAVV